MHIALVVIALIPVALMLLVAGAAFVTGSRGYLYFNDPTQAGPVARFVVMVALLGSLVLNVLLIVGVL